jgi:hypothetical protein
VITALNLVLPLMNLGEKCEVIADPDFAYGQGSITIYNFRRFLQFSAIFANFRRFLQFSAIFANFRRFLQFSAIFANFLRFLPIFRRLSPIIVKKIERFFLETNVTVFFCLNSLNNRIN